MHPSDVYNLVYKVFETPRRSVKISQILTLSVKPNIVQCIYSRYQVVSKWTKTRQRNVSYTLLQSKPSRALNNVERCKSRSNMSSVQVVVVESRTND